MKTEDFLNILDDRQLISKSVIEQLRKKVAQGDSRITSKSVLKFLVKKELISRQQAKDLLHTTLTVSNKAESSILGFVPLPTQPAEEEQATPKPMIPADDSPKQKKAIEEEVVEVEPVEVEPVEEMAVEPIAPLGDYQDANAEGLADPLLAAAGATVDFDAPDPESTPEAKGKTKKKKRDRQKNKNEWDSPLLLVGGGGLILLLISGAVIYWLINHEDAEQILANATTAFEGSSYSQAVEEYEHFVEAFPRHEKFGQAKVRLEMAKIWKATETSGKFAKALEVAQSSLKEIDSNELAAEAFASDTESKRELSSLLTKIAEGLAGQAEQSGDPKIIAQRLRQTKEVLALTRNTKFVPTTFRQGDRLGVVDETMIRVEQRQQREVDLAEALAEIDKQIAAGDPAAAFEVHKQLTLKYAGIQDNEQLVKKVQEIASAEQASVTFEKLSKPSLTTARETPVVAELTLARQTFQGTAVGASGVVLVAIDGGLYALNAGNGELIWRQPVGSAGAAAPLIVGEVAIAVDSSHGEIAAYAVATGKLQWRQPIKDRLGTPVQIGDHIFVTGQSGKLYIVRHADGLLAGQVKFSQPLTVPPVVNARGNRIYLTGDHSNIYTLSATDFTCLGVYYMGHAEGNVRVSPQPVLNKLIVADNNGTQTSTLRVFSLNKQGVVANEVVARRVKGLVTTALLVDGRRLIAVTSLGQASVFDVAPEDDQSAFTELAKREPLRGPQVARFGVVHHKHLWAAGDELSKMAILATGGKLPVRSLNQTYQGDTFDYPLQTAGDLVIHARRPQGSAGVVIAATDAKSGHQRWSTTIAVPIAGVPTVDQSSGQTQFADATGAFYRLGPQSFGKQVAAATAKARAEVEKPLTTSVVLPSGTIVASAEGLDRIALLSAVGNFTRPRLVKLAGALTCEPTSWQEGLVVPTQIGQVFLLGPEGQTMATAFQPKLTPGDQFHWRTPIAVGRGSESQLAITDGNQEIYLLSLEADPQPHLVATAAADVGASPLISRLAVLGNRVFAATEDGRLAAFILPDLEPAEPTPLDGGIVWGPYAAGEGLLMKLSTGDLAYAHDQGEIAWQVPLGQQTPVGPPLAANQNALIATSSGQILRLDLTSGATAGEIHVQQPLASGPVATGKRLAVGTPGGTLLQVDIP